MLIINHTFLIVCLSIAWQKYIKVWNIYPMEFSQTGLHAWFLNRNH